MPPYAPAALIILALALAVAAILWLRPRPPKPAALAPTPAPVSAEIEQLKEFNEDIVQHMAEGIAIENTLGTFMFVNPAGASLLGYTSDELLGQPWTKIIAPEYWSHVQAADKRRERGETDRYEIELVRKDGRRVPVLVAGNPRYDARGNFVGTLAVFTEITERKQAEEALRLQAAQLETLNRVAQVLSATLDLNEVLETIFKELKQVVLYDSAAIFQIRGNALEFLEGTGFPNRAELTGLRFDIDSPDHPNTVVIRTRAPFIVADAPVEYIGFQRDVIAKTPIRGWLGLPLLYGNQLIGMLTLDKQEPGFFTEQHARLGLAFASQAAIAIENARLFETERTARQQAEALQAATTAISLTLNLPQVLEAILVELQKVVPYDSAAVHAIKDNHREIIAGRGFENLDALMGLVFTLSPDDDYVGYQIAQTRTPLVIGDVQSEYAQFWRGPHARPKTHGWLGVPILLGDNLLGLITIDRDLPNFYTPAHGRLAMAYATQAAIALENARLFEVVSEALSREQNLKAVVEILTSTLDQPTTLQNFVRLATEIVGAQAGILAMLSPDRQHLSFPHAHNLPANVVLISVPRGNGLAWEVVDTGNPILLEHYSAHPHAMPNWVEAGAHSFIGVPVSAGGERIGVLGLFTLDEAHTFTPQQLSLAESIGRQAAIALQNVRHYEHERDQGRRQAALFRLSAELAATQDESDIWQRVVDSLYDESLGYTQLDLMEVDPVTGDRIMRAVKGYNPNVIGTHLARGQGLSDRPLLDGQLHYTPDVSTDPRHVIGLPTGSEADVPIKIDGRVSSVLVIENPRLDAFSQEDLEVFTVAANQAGLALGRARLLRETRQRLAELATINAISQAAASHLELNALLELVGNRIRQTFDVQAVFIALLDRATNTIHIPYWKYLDEHLDNLTLKLGQGLSSTIIQSRKPLLINEDYANRATALGVVPVVQQKTGRHALSWLGVPIMVGDEAIGCISAQNFEREQVFTETDVRLLSTIAANMGIAITNAQLFTASQERAAELDAALQASRSLTSSLDLTTVFDSILESAIGLMRQAENIDLFLYRDEKLVFARSASGSGKRKDVPWSEPRPAGITMTVVRTGEPVTVEDVATDERFFAPGWTGAVLGLPLKIGVRVVGVMNVAYPQPRIFTQSEQRALRLLADQAAIAIENARLYDQSLQEISERARAEEKLLQANERLQSHITEIETLQAQLREQAVRDPLTGLFNRRYLEETLDRELYRSERDGESVSVVMIDIDHFKAVNDTYGHKAGDLVLQALGQLLLNQTRRGDVACRYGGEEFIIIMPGASLKAASQRAERWRHAFEHLDVTDEGRRVQATLSIGIAIFPLHGRDSESIMRAADQAMYASKAAGRNRVAVYTRPTAS